MKSILKLSTLITIYFFSFSVLYSQTKSFVDISKIEENSGKLLIEYTITGNRADEIFDIGLEITMKNGEKIIAKSLTGDVGKNIEVKDNMKIEWDILKDNIYLDERVNIVILADVSINKYFYAKKSLLISTAILPGLGHYKLSRKPTYFVGIAAYGIVGAGILSKLSANKNYDLYLSEKDDFTQRQEYYDKANSNKVMSNILFYSAAGIWTVDFLFIALKKTKPKNTMSKINVGAFYNPYINKPEFALTYYLNY